MCFTKILSNCDEEIFSLFNRILTVLITLPISNASTKMSHTTKTQNMAEINYGGDKIVSTRSFQNVKLI